MMRLTSLLAPLACLSLAPGAQAHGRFPNPTELNFHPTDPDVMLLQTARGIVTTRDGGTTWEWLCYEAVDEETFGNADPPMALLPDGSAVVANHNKGVLTLDATWCDSSSAQPATTDDYWIETVARHPAQDDVVYALTSSPDKDNRLFRSDDGGASWKPTNDGIAQMFLESLDFDPEAADPESTVMYIAALDDAPETREGVVFRSGDGGAKWDEIHRFALATGEQTLRVAAVDPDDPDRVFIWVRHDTRATEPPPDRLLVIEGADQETRTVEQVFSTSAIGGVAISDDGNRVWVGNETDGGLWRSDDAGAAGSFNQVQTGVQVNCLQWHEDELWLCANNFVDGYAIGRSTDGESINPFMSFSDIDGTLSCPEGTVAGDICGAFAEDALRELGVEGGAGGDGGTTADGGTMDGSGGGGCGVTAPSPGRSGWGGGMFALLVALVLVRRRRS